MTPLPTDTDVSVTPDPTTVLQIPLFVSIAAVSVAALTLLFAIIKHIREQKLKRRLVSIRVASNLEALSRHCLLVSKDQGTWYEPDYPVRDDYHNHNETTINWPDIPSFTEIDDLELINRKQLNKLLALEPLEQSIQRSVRSQAIDDSPDYGMFFMYRRLFYAGLGEYIANLAFKIRKSVNAPGIGAIATTTLYELQAEMKSVLVANPRFVESLKQNYAKDFLPIGESYWPS